MSIKNYNYYYYKRQETCYEAANFKKIGNSRRATLFTRMTSITLRWGFNRKKIFNAKKI